MTTKLALLSLLLLSGCVSSARYKRDLGWTAIIFYNRGLKDMSKHELPDEKTLGTEIHDFIQETSK